MRVKIIIGVFKSMFGTVLNYISIMWIAMLASFDFGIFSSDNIKAPIDSFLLIISGIAALVFTSAKMYSTFHDIKVKRDVALKEDENRKRLQDLEEQKRLEDIDHQREMAKLMQKAKQLEIDMLSADLQRKIHQSSVEEERKNTLKDINDKLDKRHEG